ncbi:MAG TPA: hypothetical protein PLU87_03060 [Sedimentisphaerales bacterium]|nr:hypothetical protein [Sedimentisphaerales bacterium]HRS10001.1 hypothetical protein [Sedimentisphaerales bacterium]HRV46707.1 hypothetical protein [Sedimentisphaerales bacterium]
MNELLLRVETLCAEVDSTILLGAGAGMAVVGLFLWLGGARYGTIVIALLGAAVGAMIGLLVSQKAGLGPFLCMAVGAVILSILSIAARNGLVIVLATVIFALLTATVYTSYVLDRQPAEEATPRAAAPGSSFAASGESQFVYQSFSSMDPNSRQAYIDSLGGSKDDFQSRLKVVLADLWRALGPYRWYLLGAILIGGVGGFLLIWFIKNVVLPLCYSVVGTTAALLGVQVLLLGLGARVVSDLSPRPWIVPTAFGSMTLIGWVRQLLAGHKRQARAESAAGGPKEAKHE